MKAIGYKQCGPISAPESLIEIDAPEPEIGGGLVIVNRPGTGVVRQVTSGPLWTSDDLSHGLSSLGCSSSDTQIEGVVVLEFCDGDLVPNQVFA